MSNMYRFFFFFCCLSVYSSLNNEKYFYPYTKKRFPTKRWIEICNSSNITTISFINIKNT